MANPCFKRNGVSDLRKERRENNLNCAFKLFSLLSFYIYKQNAFNILSCHFINSMRTQVYGVQLIHKENNALGIPAVTSYIILTGCVSSVVSACSVVVNTSD